MSNLPTKTFSVPSFLQSDCKNCFGLCCTALPFAKSADFAFDKNSGTPCPNLDGEFHCRIHPHLRQEGFRGCTVYECFGAGQKVSGIIFKGESWRDHPQVSGLMFDVFPVFQQLQEMLLYLHEARTFSVTLPIHRELEAAMEKTEKLTRMEPDDILQVDIQSHRSRINDLLLQTSERVRRGRSSAVSVKMKRRKGMAWLGADLRGADLQGLDLRGAFLIAANLKGANMQYTDLIGADLRDADISGADLRGAIFLTQVQVNSAKGDRHTKLPRSFRIPEHWRAACEGEDSHEK
ncbi:pentapeptide repeat-containing protein [Peribacillus sp. SCS-26]|uniref:pentapeptide repeat-containing protein n=1 Tax=Paraperibacillus marinus TaxID=3115295 RepID=UPI003905E31B